MFDEVHPNFDAKAFADEMKVSHLDVLRGRGAAIRPRADRARRHRRERVRPKRVAEFVAVALAGVTQDMDTEREWRNGSD